MDKRIVIPENLGIGFVWDSSTKKFNVKVKGLSTDESGNLSVGLSKTAGNLLQMYADGLYYGIQAPANVSNLYVDAVSGVDADPNEVRGAGSRAKPLKTVNYALRLKPTNTRSNIYLMEGQEHHLYYSDMSAEDKSQKGISYISYGPKTDELATKTNPDSWNRYRTTERGSKAKLVFVADQRNSRNVLLFGPVLWEGDTYFLNLELGIQNVLPNDTNFNMNSNNVFGENTRVHFVGCYIHGDPTGKIKWFQQNAAYIMFDHSRIMSDVSLFATLRPAPLVNIAFSRSIERAENVSSEDFAEGLAVEYLSNTVHLIKFNAPSDLGKWFVGGTRNPPRANIISYYDIGLRS